LGSGLIRNRQRRRHDHLACAGKRYRVSYRLRRQTAVKGIESNLHRDRSVADSVCAGFRR
jgi:hypothetical protein